MSEKYPEIPDTIDGEPVVEVQEATDPLTPEEIEAAQEEEGA
jgi:hypothetical protein